MMTRFQHFPIRVTPFFYSLAQCGILLHILAPSIAQAQVTTAITSDGTLGTTVTQNANINDISGGTRSVGGPNLFHSFGEFSVGAGDIASFNGPAGIANILSRVTGGDPSNIFGTIRSTIDGANLFLMNPAGVLFGPTASLDVSGSFHVTTADYLRLTDNAQFTAVPGPADAGLSVASVAAFGFLNENPAGINVDSSSLSVPEGKTLSLVGGDIAIAGNPDLPREERIPSLAAEGGQINLVSVGAAGEVEPITPDVSVDSFERLGEITLSKAAFVDTSGDGGGTVVIRGGRLTIDESRISANTTGPAEGPLEGQSGMGIDIQVAEDLLLDNGSIIETNTDGFGDSGRISLKVNNDLEVRNGSLIQTVAFQGPSIAGDIEIRADRVLLSGTAESLTGLRSLIGPPASGAAGDIRVTANSLEIVDAFISTLTFGAGDAGIIDVNVEGGDVFISGSSAPDTFFGIFTNTLTLPDNPVSTGAGGHLQLTAHNLKLANVASLQASTEGSGAAGDLTVTLTGNLEVEDGSFIQTRAFPGATGDAGDLSITAQDIVVTGISEATNFEGPFEGSSEFTGISASAADGLGGDLTIEANNLTVRDKAFVNTATRGSGNSGNLSINLSGNLLIENGGLIFADAQIGSSGAAGAIDIQANNIVLSGANPTLSRRVDGSVLVPTRSTITSQSRGEGGKGGDILVTARRLSVLDGASITAKSTSPGDAGSIEIRASDSILIDNSSITTDAEQADGGNITLMAPNIIHLIDSELSTSVEGGPQTTGGAIDIDPQFVVLENSQIKTTAIEGDGGNISITAGAFLADPASVIDVSSLSGSPGNVEINSPDTNIIEGTLELPESFLDVQSLLSTRCASRTTKPASSFFVTNGGLPLGPDTLIPAGVTGVGINSGESDGPQSDHSDEIPELLVRTSAFGGCTGSI